MMLLDVSVFEKWRSDLMEIDLLLDEYIKTTPDVAEAAEMLTQLNMVKRDLGVIYDSFAGKVGSIMGNRGMVETQSGATVEKKGATERKKWDHPKLANRVAERLNEMSVDIDTGERMMTATQMVEKLLDYAAVSYWRVGKLGELGINPDLYCEQGEHKTSIIVRLGDKNK
jgi:hypothetical protein